MLKAAAAQSVPNVRPQALNQERMMCLLARTRKLKSQSRGDGNRLTADHGPAEKAAKCRKTAGIRLDEFER
jgi:hypothetical protein